MKLIIPVLLAFLFYSCEDENFIPKPPSYLRLELPEHSYYNFSDSCNYSFKLSKMFKVKTRDNQSESNCNKEIDLGPLNGTLFLHYWDFNESLAFYINNANDEISKHKVKATTINDERIIRTEDRVFGTLFELQGNVATPFQFYLTDSTSRFIYGEILFNSTPNYDSLKPTLDYFKRDLDSLINSFQWEN